MKNRVSCVGLFFAFVLGIQLDLSSQEVARVKDFRGTPQSLALLGATSEFVDPAVKEQSLMQLRRYLNRYTRSFGESSISNFKLGQNLNDQFFRPVTGSMSDPQKNFLKAASKDNGIDIIALASLREVGDGNNEIEVQLFDQRIETLSATEKAQFNRSTQQRMLDDLAYRVMNYLDKEGFVHPEPQGFLERPAGFEAMGGNTSPQGRAAEEFSVNPSDLTGKSLAGAPSIAGDQTPFWEKWWFWTLVGGGLATAGGLSFYFVAVDKDPSQGNITFQLP